MQLRRPRLAEHAHLHGELGREHEQQLLAAQAVSALHVARDRDAALALRIGRDVADLIRVRCRVRVRVNNKVRVTLILTLNMTLTLTLTLTLTPTLKRSVRPSPKSSEPLTLRAVRENEAAGGSSSVGASVGGGSGTETEALPLPSSFRHTVGRALVVASAATDTWSFVLGSLLVGGAL